MADQYLFRADWPHRWRRRSGLRRDSDVEKMPKEMLIWHKQTLKARKDIKVGLMTDLGLMTLFWYWSDFSPASKPRHGQMPW